MWNVFIPKLGGICNVPCKAAVTISNSEQQQTTTTTLFRAVVVAKIVSLFVKWSRRRWGWRLWPRRFPHLIQCHHHMFGRAICRSWIVLMQHAARNNHADLARSLFYFRMCTSECFKLNRYFYQYHRLCRFHCHVNILHTRNGRACGRDWSTRAFILFSRLCEALLHSAQTEYPLKWGGFTFMWTATC